MVLLLRVNIQKYMRKGNDFHLAFYWSLHKTRRDKMQKIRKTDMSGLKKKWKNNENIDAGCG